jgi:hypothetical protein
MNKILVLCLAVSVWGVSLCGEDEKGSLANLQDGDTNVWLASLGPKKVEDKCSGDKIEECCLPPGYTMKDAVRASWKEYLAGKDNYEVETSSRAIDNVYSKDYWDDSDWELYHKMKKDNRKGYWDSDDWGLFWELKKELEEEK